MTQASEILIMLSFVTKILLFGYQFYEGRIKSALFEHTYFRKSSCFDNFLIKVILRGS